VLKGIVAGKDTEMLILAQSENSLREKQTELEQIKAKVSVAQEVFESLITELERMESRKHKETEALEAARKTACADKNL